MLFDERLSSAKCRPARALDETGLEQERHDRGFAHRLAVEALDREASLSRAAEVLDQCREGLAEPVFLGIAQRDERAAAALHEQRGLAAEQDDPCACNSGGSGARALRPGQRGSVRLGGIGCREDKWLRFIIISLAELSQSLDRAAERELRAAEALDEVASPAEAERLERAQLTVDGAVAARDAFGADGLPRHDPVALEQQLGERAPVGGARGK